MTVNYTTLLQLPQPVDGTEAGTWGDVLNNAQAAYLDIAIAGGLAITVTTTDVTLAYTQGTSSATNIGSTTSQYAILNVSGAMTGARNLIVPSTSKWYIINNTCSGGYTLTVKGSATTGVGIVNGEKALVAWNGSDFVKVASNQITALTGVLPNTSGGTGQSGAFTQYGVTYANATTTLATTAAGTSTTVLHGNASGAPTFGAVSLTADVSGTLPIANGGTGASTLAGANIAVINATQTFTATQTLSGSSSAEALVTPNIAEVDTISATAATGTINFDITTQSVLYYTSNASGNFTVNFRGSSGTSLNTLMSTGQSISATFLVTNGTTAYYNSAVTIDGTSVTPKWQNGSAPTSGNASSTDCYTYVIQKTGSATYVVLASQTKFA
jgi:hypothetical protein